MRRAAILLLLLPSVAIAQEVDCSKAQVQVELNFCAERAWKLADEDLNLAYGFARDAMRRIDEALPVDQRGAEESLRTAQRDWIAFRDSGCTAEGFRVRGGSMESMVVYACRERVTRVRTEELRTLGETW